jgi:hypothetical protein
MIRADGVETSGTYQVTKQAHTSPEIGDLGSKSKTGDRRPKIRLYGVRTSMSLSFVSAFTTNPSPLSARYPTRAPGSQHDDVTTRFHFRRAIASITFPIFNSQNVHVGDNHVYNGPHGLDPNHLAEVLRKRPQSINRKAIPELKDGKKRSTEAQNVHFDYRLPPHIRSGFPDLENLTPYFETSNESRTSSARRFINMLRIKSISNPLDNFVSNCLKERLDKIQADLDEAKRPSEGNRRDQWKQAIGTDVEIAVTKNNTLTYMIF